MKLIYIAGPFRGLTAWDIEQNIRGAEGWALTVAASGAVPVVPHSMYRYFQGAMKDEFRLEATLEILRRCDAVLLTPGWRKSQGSLGELAEAQRLGIPQFETERGQLSKPLLDWIAKVKS